MSLTRSNGIEFADWQLECCGVRERGARLLESAQWTDCTFLLGPDRVPACAHRLILAAASPEFQRMLYGVGAEGNSSIHIPDIHPEVFQKLLIYIYSDKIDLDNHNNAIELYCAAQQYKLRYLLVECTEYLASALTPKNACRIYEFANFIGDQKLQDKSLQVIQKKTKLALSNLTSFNDVALGTVIDIFSMDDLTIDSELDLLAAAEQYVLERRLMRHEFEKLKASENNADSTSPNVNLEGGRISNGDVMENIKVDHLNGITENNDDEIPKVKNETTKLTSLDIEKKNDNGRSEATFRYTIHNFSTLKGKETSADYYIRDLPWKLSVRPSFSQKQKRLAIFLHCNSESKSVSWSCEARAEVKIVSPHNNTELLYGKMQHLFCRRSSNRGFRYYKRWNDILEYIKDDSITLEVHVSAEAPQGFAWDLMKIDLYVELTDAAIQAIVRQIRFLALSAKSLAEYEPKTPLLTEHEFLAFVMNILSEKTHIPLPEGFSTIRRARNTTHAFK